MADINESLKAYMSKEPLLGSGDGPRSQFSFGNLNPFRKTEPSGYDESSEVGNGWFSQAQKDPLCPGLVKH